MTRGNTYFDADEEGREKLQEEIMAMLKTLKPIRIEMYKTKDSFHWVTGSSIGNSPPRLCGGLKRRF